MHFRHLMSVHFQTLYFFHRFRTLQVINVSATFTKKMGMNGSICIKISIFLIFYLFIPNNSLSLHWIYNCNEYKFGKKGINDETIRTIIRP